MRNWKEAVLKLKRLKYVSVGKSHVDIINEEMIWSSSEEEDMWIRKCRRKSLVDIINEEVKVWTSSLKQQEYPPEPTKTKENICLE